jgi:hypothetical protein
MALEAQGARLHSRKLPLVTRSSLARRLRCDCRQPCCGLFCGATAEVCRPRRGGALSTGYIAAAARAPAMRASYLMCHLMCCCFQSKRGRRCGERPTRLWVPIGSTHCGLLVRGANPPPPHLSSQQSRSAPALLRLKVGLLQAQRPGTEACLWPKAREDERRVTCVHSRELFVLVGRTCMQCTPRICCPGVSSDVLHFYSQPTAGVCHAFAAAPAVSARRRSPPAFSGEVHRAARSCSPQNGARH